MALPTIGHLRKASRIEVPPYPKTAKETEGLTGYVHGLEASDLEERFANALSKNGLDFQFQYRVLTASGVPGQEDVVDFIVESGQPQPIEIDGAFVHKSAAQRQYDMRRDALVNAALAPYGYLPILRISGEDIPDPEHADLIARDLL